MAGKALDPLPKYWTIGKAEQTNLMKALKRPLSGYIGGHPSTGYWVNELSDMWRSEFGCNYATPCNSGTSGLMAACMAADIGHGDLVWCSTYTMSATATCAMMLGATVKFMDICPTYFTMTETVFKPLPKAIIITNLFGCGGSLPQLRSFCDEHHITMIEDNAQAPFATVGGKFTGTIGHIGVFSLNVHKHIQCGEGGVVVTDDSRYAARLEDAVNHGELGQHPDDLVNHLGGNFRMAEPIAAIACAQLRKGFNLVQGRIALAEEISGMFHEVSFVQPPVKRHGETHAYYMWAGKITGERACDIRAVFVTSLQRRGVPFRIGYSPLLHKLFEEDYSLPVAEEIQNERLFTFEICAYDPKQHHLNRMQDIIQDEAGKIE